MRHSRTKPFAGAAVALALCFSPTVATAATSTPIQSISPLVAVSVFGTQASAEAVCNPATAAAAAGAAAVAQGQAGCVLPATDLPPPVAQNAPPPVAQGISGFGIAPVILGLLGIAALAALIASGNNDSDSPSSPS
jgi:hypothetical protein